MVERGAGGSIINIGSVVGQVGIDTGNANYAASKGGMIGLTKCLAVEWAPFGVRVNVVAPTHFRTPLVEQAIRDHPGIEQRFLSNIPLGRLGCTQRDRGRGGLPCVRRCVDGDRARPQRRWGAHGQMTRGAALANFMARSRWE